MDTSLKGRIQVRLFHPSDNFIPFHPVSSCFIPFHPVSSLGPAQARFAQSLEEVIRAVVADAGDLARTSQRHSEQLAAQSQHLNDTREALTRCSTVFSALLGVPSPTPQNVNSLQLQDT